MLILQGNGRFTISYKCQHIDPSCLHYRSCYFPSPSVNDIYHSGWETITESFKQRGEQENTMFGWLQDDRISHDECRDQQSESLVQGIIVWSKTKDNPQRTSPNMCIDLGSFLELGGIAVQFFIFFNGVVNVFYGPVKFFLRVREGFPDLPHQVIHHLLFRGLHLGNKFLHTGDPI